LIVDDAKLDRAIAGECLREAGFEPAYAENGVEAMASIQREPPDLVLTDLVMPQMDGLALVQRIRRDFPRVPIILMTGQGADDTAALALRAGAASYIPKRFLKQSLGDTVRSVLATAKALSTQRDAWTLLNYRESLYVLGYEPDGRTTLIAHLEEELDRFHLCDASERIRVGTALSEALTNAVDHGNLELDSALRETSDHEYFELGRRRATEPPYRDRRVYVTTRLTPSEVTFIIRDEGPGFDHEDLPDPTDPENLAKLSGRGLLLIRTFMDDVRFNDLGNEITMVKRRNGIPADAD
jgi:CheY-like chemotaxis protein/anti-sigma regulatory factor (Ser/Thr protein kinase)